MTIFGRYVYVYVCRSILYLNLFSPFCTYHYEISKQTYHREFEVCVCMQLWEIIRVPCTKSSLLALHCCTLCYFLMSYVKVTIPFYCASMFTLQKFLNTTCTLVATSMILQKLECITWGENACNLILACACTHTHINFDLNISIRNLKLAYMIAFEMNKLQTYGDHVSTRPPLPWL